MKGIYIITNPAYGDDVIKIGYGDDVDKRIEEFNKSTGVLYPFVKRAVLETEGRLTDLDIHQMIDRINPSMRITKNKEFYTLNYLDMIEWLKHLCRLSGIESKLHIFNESKEDVTNEREADKAFRRSPFKFSMVNLHEGDTIIYIKDNSITATVAEDDKHVIYNGERYSLSTLAQILAGVTSVVCGTDVFSVDGRIPLNELRVQFETQS